MLVISVSVHSLLLDFMLAFPLLTLLEAILQYISVLVEVYVALLRWPHLPGVFTYNEAHLVSVSKQ